MPNISIFKGGGNDTVPVTITLSEALERVRTGVSWPLVQRVRAANSKDEAKPLKMMLPCITFSGTFKGGKAISHMEQHSGFIGLDWDGIPEENVVARKSEICKNEYIYACWISPSGKGLRGLMKIADGSKHAQHFDSIVMEFPDIDKSCRNPNRIWFESADSKIYINEKAKIYSKIKVFKVPDKLDQIMTGAPVTEQDRIFANLVSWNLKRHQFEDGNKATFLFRLATACCRYGIAESDTAYFIISKYIPNQVEYAEKLTRNAYKTAGNDFNTAIFTSGGSFVKRSDPTSEILQVEIPEEIDLTEKIQDVIYAEDVLDQALDLWKNGYESVLGIGVPELDALFKIKAKELTLLSGYANYGKSQFLKWYLLMHVIKHGRKFAIFPPEDYPAHEFYHNMTEVLIGGPCTPGFQGGPTEDEYKAAFAFLNKHIFFVYPQDGMPTPERIQGIFLQVIMKEKITACIIDPYNQLAHQYSGDNEHRYLEQFLGQMSRFSQSNDVSTIIVAHPNKPDKVASNENWSPPNYYNITGGSMWANKMDNIVFYHRPYRNTDKTNPSCEFHTAKIKRQRVVGDLGDAAFGFRFPKRRYFFNDIDYMELALKEKGISFKFTEHKEFDVLIPEQKESAMKMVSAMERATQFEAQYVSKRELEEDGLAPFGKVSDGTPF
jgi:hypothetical protein